ncbi:hypothetical protein SASPL_105470 [Salvia splendens]|uniref:Uncharacterized protein n=1 Tax=Salvia splendens TaxID=180675 RepID=A0A8X8YNN6_SALSN|nr:hypothetical protein SASPL_105470 [Salvia splendens]
MLYSRGYMEYLRCGTIDDSRERLHYVREILRWHLKLNDLRIKGHEAVSIMCEAEISGCNPFTGHTKESRGRRLGYTSLPSTGLLHLSTSLFDF